MAGINLSELDGWWAEAFEPDLGWALGMVRNMAMILRGTPSRPESLYDLLEQEVIPEFYTRDERGIPTAWVTRMRESMARLTPPLLRQPRRTRLYRAILHSGCCRLPVA